MDVTGGSPRHLRVCRHLRRSRFRAGRSLYREAGPGGQFLTRDLSQVKGWSPLSSLRLLDEFRFQLHCADAVDPAVDVMVAIDETDDLDLGSDLDHR